MRTLMVLAIATFPVFAAEVETAKLYFPFGGKQVGRWTSGALVGVDTPAPVLYAFDKQGQQIGNIVIRTPADASGYQIYRVVRGPDGTYAAGGIAYLPSGAAAYVWRISADGSQQQAIPTAPYIASEVVLAGDGSIWTAGAQKQTVKMSYEDYAESHNVVRRYAPDGRLTGSWLDWKSVARDRVHPAPGSFMLASRDRVGWYPPSGSQYIEFSLDGQIAGRYPTAPMASGQSLTGVALCSDGGLFAARQVRGAKGGPERWEVLTLDRSAGAWRPASDVPESRSGVLYGCEGDKLVTSTRPGDGAKILDFWVPGPVRP
jgi:hypothetical protein